MQRHLVLLTRPVAKGGRAPTKPECPPLEQNVLHLRYCKKGKFSCKRVKFCLCESIGSMIQRRAGKGSFRVTHDSSDPLSSWPMTHVTHDPCDHGSSGPSPHTSASLTQIYRLSGTVFGHCICRHTFKLLHNCTCKQTAHTGTCKFRVLIYYHCHNI